MGKKEKKQVGRPTKEASVPRPARKQKRKQTGDRVEEPFGVHIISDQDIENHFGTSQRESGDESKKEQ